MRLGGRRKTGHRAQSGLGRHDRNCCRRARDAVEATPATGCRRPA